MIANHIIILLFFQVFERAKTAREDSIGVDPLAIQLISLCPESRKLCVASAGGHVILFKFKKNESTSVTTVHVFLFYTININSNSNFFCTKIENYFNDFLLSS